MPVHIQILAKLIKPMEKKEILMPIFLRVLYFGIIFCLAFHVFKKHRKKVNID